MECYRGQTINLLEKGCSVRRNEAIKVCFGKWSSASAHIDRMAVSMRNPRRRLAARPDRSADEKKLGGRIDWIREESTFLKEINVSPISVQLKFLSDDK